MRKDKKAPLPKEVPNHNLLEVTSLYAILRGFRHPNFNFKGEYHASWELVYIIDGHMGVSADGRVYELQSGDLILHKPMEFHTLKTLGDKSAEVFIMTFSLNGELAYNLNNLVMHPTGSAAQALQMLMETLEAHGSRKSALDSVDYLVILGKGLANQLVFSQLESFLLLLLFTAYPAMPTVKNHSTNLYQQIVDILEENKYGHITIEEVAKQCQRSTSSVKNHFKTYTGCSIHKYYLKIKMRTAIELLGEGMSVGQVSETLGFEDPNYFSTAFKREISRNATFYT